MLWYNNRELAPWHVCLFMSVYKKLRTYPRAFVLGGGGTLLFVLIVTHTLPAGAETAFLGSLFTDRQIEVKTDEVTKTTQNFHTHTWNGFSDEVPEGSVVSEISLVFSWSQSASSLETVQAEVVLPTLVEEAETSTRKSDGGVSEENDILVSEETVPMEGETESAVHLEETPPQETESNEVTETLLSPLPEGSIEATIEEVSDEDGSSVFEEEISEGENATENSRSDVTSLDPVVGFKSVPLQQYLLTSLAFEETNETEPVVFDDVVINEEQGSVTPEEFSVVSEESVSEVLETFVVTAEEVVPQGQEEEEAASRPEEETATELIDGEIAEVPPASPVLYPTRENADVLYSLDGDSWTLLGVLNLLDKTSAEFSLPKISLTALPTLQVRVVYLAPQDAPTFLFQNTQVKVEYTPGVVEEVIEASSEREPNFLVGVVRADTQSGRVRAVLLERGGLLEMWAGISVKDSESIIWNKLSSGDTIDAGMPIAVKNGSVFWFDRNAETLLGYDVFKNSLTGTSPTVGEGGKKAFTLIFGSEEKLWEATYNPEAHTLEFSQVKDRSQ